MPANHTIVVTFDAHVFLSPVSHGLVLPEPSVSTSLRALTGESEMNGGVF